jgi:hypothetical protein
MNKKNIQWIWAFTLIIAASLGCNLFSRVGQDVQEMKDTADAAVNQVKGIVTQAQGLATAIDESDFLQTAQAFATEQGPELLAQAQALATQAHESGYLQTAQAKATEGVSFGQAPDDIPLVPEGSISNFFGSEMIVSFSSSLDFASVIEFYQREMPAHGWVHLQGDSSQTETTAVLKYEKGERSVSMAVNTNPLDKTTVVMIMIQSQ